MAAEAPPPGEPVHLPGPSYVPVIVAAGVALAVSGVVVLWVLSVAGALIALFGVIRWIRQTREEIGELPLEH